MLECGSAILIAESGDEVWRPSENVVHELGAASIQYEERVVIFKEKGVIEAKAMDLLRELVSFNLVKISRHDHR